jgi:tRNA dimethylallyltransferase
MLSDASTEPSPPLKSAEPNYPAVAILGPTASGKSALSLAIAESVGGEVVNYDSVQMYRGFDVGSGKLTESERKGIPHHLLGIVAAGQAMTAGEFQRRARQVLELIRARRKVPVLAGGTGLYLRSLIEGLFEGPTRSEELRDRLRRIARRRGRHFLHRMLERLDPLAAERIHARDTQKVIRAIEVSRLAGEAISQLQSKGRNGIPGFRFFKIGLDPDRSELYERINRRVERIFAEGLLDETRAALGELRLPVDPLPPPLQALGYRQAVAFLQGEQPLARAIRDAQSATRRYAKRQMTWLRGESEVCWFHGFGDQEETVRLVLEHIKQIPVG